MPGRAQKKRPDRLQEPPSAYHVVWQCVCKIPRGKVATYGQIARICGMDGHARLVGYALHGLPHGLDVPWHRVVNAKGKISFPPKTQSYQKQAALLQKEGVVFVNTTIDLTTFGWKRIPRRQH